MSAEQQAPDGLMEAFAAYEAALMADDLTTLDRLFAPGDATLRGDAAGLLVGHEAISTFRGGRGGAPQRRIVETHVQVVDADHALVIAVTELARGGRGQQTQLWRRAEQGWQITAAHVAVPAPALDARIWRVVGDPLLRGADDGPLAGETMAVKDLYAVAGHRLGAGNPAREAAAAPEQQHAAAVASLLAAGADVRGIARTDEFAYSLAGTNHHHGTPPNPKAPRRIPGGSSSGSASAVSLGHATIGLGTDTGGSVRVPAAYQGLYGIRTSHDVVDRDGLLPLAPSFDTVGWLTRSADLLLRVGEVLLPQDGGGGAPVATRDLVIADSLLDLAESDVSVAVSAWGDAVGARRVAWPVDDLPRWLDAFRTWQAHEAWQAHGAWLETRLDTLGPDVRGRFDIARSVDAGDAAAARAVVDEARDRLRDRIGDQVLVLPSAASVAPFPDRAAAAREATMLLTCLAGLAGAPAVSVPVATTEDLPAGVCLVAAPGRDLDLLRFAADHA